MAISKKKKITSQIWININSFSPFPLKIHNKGLTVFHLFIWFPMDTTEIPSIWVCIWFFIAYILLVIFPQTLQCHILSLLSITYLIPISHLYPSFQQLQSHSNGRTFYKTFTHLTFTFYATYFYTCVVVDVLIRKYSFAITVPIPFICS